MTPAIGYCLDAQKDALNQLSGSELGPGGIRTLDLCRVRAASLTGLDYRPTCQIYSRFPKKEFSHIELPSEPADFSNLEKKMLLRCFQSVEYWVRNLPQACPAN